MLEKRLFGLLFGFSDVLTIIAKLTPALIKAHDHKPEQDLSSKGYNLDNVPTLNECDGCHIKIRSQMQSAGDNTWIPEMMINIDR